jgi:hypothetical protein
MSEEQRKIASHCKFINDSITRIVSGGDPEEERVQLFSVRELLLEENRLLAATLINGALHHLEATDKNYLLAHQMAAIQNLNRAISQLPKIS